MEFLLRQIPNDYSFKKEYLDKHANEIQTLVLGASSGYFGINPVYFSKNTFNACHVSQSLDYDLEILKKYQHDLNRLETVILPIPFATLWAKLSKSPEAWRVKNYMIYYKMNTSHSFSDYTELLSNKMTINIKKLINYYIHKKRETISTELGWNVLFKSGNIQELDETGKIAALKHSISNISSIDKLKRYNENLTILNSLARICDGKQVKVIFFTPPEYKSYRENLNKKQSLKTIETMTNFVKEHTNCQYLDLSDDPDFEAKDFYDADHLNEIGAEKLSKKIKAIIENN
jgi:hypothetical protein